jgi:hypothetical protein
LFVLDKPKFLSQTAKGPDVADYRLEQARVRIFGDAALVHGTGRFTRKDGTAGTSRYTDVYVRMLGENHPHVKVAGALTEKRAPPAFRPGAPKLADQMNLAAL